MILGVPNKLGPYEGVFYLKQQLVIGPIYAKYNHLAFRQPTLNITKVYNQAVRVPYIRFANASNKWITLRVWNSLFLFAHTKFEMTNLLFSSMLLQSATVGLGGCSQSRVSFKTHEITGCFHPPASRSMQRFTLRAPDPTNLRTNTENQTLWIISAVPGIILINQHVYLERPLMNGLHEV